MQIGEFIGDAPDANATHHRRPFACGGAGTIVSAAGMLAAAPTLGDCLRSFNDTCMQSDWMIGRCLERAGVMPVEEYGCGLCGLKVRRRATLHPPAALVLLRGRV